MAQIISTPLSKFPYINFTNTGGDFITKNGGQNLPLRQNEPKHKCLIDTPSVLRKRQKFSSGHFCSKITWLNWASNVRQELVPEDRIRLLDWLSDWIIHNRAKWFPLLQPIKFTTTSIFGHQFLKIQSLPIRTSQTSYGNGSWNFFPISHNQVYHPSVTYIWCCPSKNENEYLTLSLTQLRASHVMAPNLSFSLFEGQHRIRLVETALKCDRIPRLWCSFNGD